jgi:hypothetical protein
MTATARFDPLTFRPRFETNGIARNTPLVVAPALLIERDLESPASRVARRTRIWDLSSHLHCSIVGTCLSTTELRQILVKAGMAVEGASDHDLHAQGVLLAGQRDGRGKLLHKALDRRHRSALSRFDKAETIDDVRALWQLALKDGDIPGAYWAAMTHSAATNTLIREIFGDVHMLSHLVGAANRADIRRLKALETENAELREKLGRQQVRLQQDITARDARIRDLNAALARRIAEETTNRNSSDGAGEETSLNELIGDLDHRLRAETNRRAVIEERVARLAGELRQERAERGAAESRESALRRELEAVEASLAFSATHDEAASPGGSEVSPAPLAGLSVLYVGGRPDKLGHLRAVGEQFGARFLHHDGGIDDRSGLLAGVVSRADVVMFPVDCVSHEAVAMVKRLCRQMSKPYFPLRSTGMSSFVAALTLAAGSTNHSQT